MLNDIENEKLIEDCKRANLSYGEYFRKLLMHEQIKEKPDRDFLKILNQLSKIGVNINQIAHKVNGLGEFDKERYEQEANYLFKMLKDLKRKYL